MPMKLRFGLETTMISPGYMNHEQLLDYLVKQATKWQATERRYLGRAE